MSVTKSEQNILDRIRAANDAGQLARDYDVVGRTKGKPGNGRTHRGYVSSKPIARETEALERLLASGAVIEAPPNPKLGSGLALADHAILADVATAIDLQRARDEIDAAETVLRFRQADLARLESFINRYGRKESK